MTATRDEREDTAVARLKMAHTRADLLNDSCSFVSQHDGHRKISLPKHYVMVRGADSGSSDPHTHLTGLRSNLFDLLDRHSLVWSVEHRRLNH